MFDPITFTYVSAIAVFAGIVKGILGNGFPVIMIGLLTLFMGLQEAIAVTVIPAFITNFWQALVGGFLGVLLRRLWPYLLASMIAVLIGTQFLIISPPAVLIIILGSLIGAYGILGLSGMKLAIPARWEKTAGPVFGTLTGLVAGMTGSPAYPGMFFLNGLGYNKNQLVQALGISFSVVTLTVALSMKGNNLFSYEQFLLSISAVIPAMIGMAMGTHIRHRISEELFRKYFFLLMLVLASYLIFRSISRMMIG